MFKAISDIHAAASKVNSTVTAAATDAASKAAEKVKSTALNAANIVTMRGADCSVDGCDNGSIVQCVCCERNYCKDHQVLEQSKGISKKKSDLLHIPEKLKAAQFKSCQSLLEKQDNAQSGAFSAFSNSCADAIGTVKSVTGNDYEFACCYPGPDGVSCKDKCAEHFMQEFEATALTKCRMLELDAYLSKGGKDSSHLDFDKPYRKHGGMNSRAMIAAYETIQVGLKYGPFGELYYVGTALVYGMQGKVLADLISKQFGLNNSVTEMVSGLCERSYHDVR